MPKKQHISTKAKAVHYMLVKLTHIKPVEYDNAKWKENIERVPKRR